MTHKPPPVPPEQQSHKGPGSGERAPTDTTAHGKAANVPKNLAEQDRPAVAELRHELPELMTGIGRRERCRPLRDTVPGQSRYAFRAREPVRVETEVLGQRSVQPDQARCCYRRRRAGRIEALR